ncbi:Protein of uncharacterised function (DUF3408) [Bacteroides uniformis]|uniref:Protein of uncharacterized function (DUF3408) n=1 Tax=Bacteroides uniformis TaxID=820 RepID=A0A174RY26_BACUN|nr:DUF3408 domain-containing protein [Bacteroides uniformis]CUP90362.1 Protein of uncharacterised function (DUF3408) [Bacteroides uniformis]
MANKRRSVYNVDEDALKRVVAGDVTALEQLQQSEDVQPEKTSEDTGMETVPQESETRASVPAVRKTSVPRKSVQHPERDEYRRQFLQVKLTGARRQTYLHDSIYKSCAKILPVIAPDMSVPTFINSVMSDHLKRYKSVINGIYNEEASKEAIDVE